MQTVVFLVLRASHVFLAALWFGSAVFISETLMPAIDASGPAGSQVMASLNRRITVSTIHRAKGAEATLVILLGCEEQVLPCWQALSDQDPEALCEERRLFYVACTRAKDRLILTRALARGGRDTGGPSRFLHEAGLASAPHSLAA